MKIHEKSEEIRSPAQELNPEPSRSANYYAATSLYHLALRYQEMSKF